MKIDWDDRAKANFQQMFAEGATYQKMADRFGVTKGAISRQCCRLGLKRKEPNPPERRAELKKARDERAAQAKRDKRASRFAMGVGAQVQAINRGPQVRPQPFVCKEEPRIEPLGVKIMELTDKTCRWPIGSDPSPDVMTYCGHLPFGSSSYCKPHFLLGTGHGTRGEQSALRLHRKVA
jgi:hypothetical protein